MNTTMKLGIATLSLNALIASGMAVKSQVFTTTASSPAVYNQVPMQGMWASSGGLTFNSSGSRLRPRARSRQ